MLLQYKGLSVYYKEMFGGQNDKKWMFLNFV